MNPVNHPDVIILGAGAAGLMCAIEAGKRGRKVLVLDHANKAGKKILMSGGGRCNFTNYQVSAGNFLSANPHFCKSALSRFTQWDFIAMVEEHGIAYHERDHGQLFCNDSARDILNMLLSEAARYKVVLQLNTTINEVQREQCQHAFRVSAQHNGKPQTWQAESLVVATGGLSIPKMCASPLGYQIAEQFAVPILPTRAALVPFTLHDADKQRFAPLSGIAIDSELSTASQQFRENLLFTHRGLSGPAVLQISSYWHPGETLQIRLLVDRDLQGDLAEQRQVTPNRHLRTVLQQWLPRRLTDCLVPTELLDSPMQHLSRLDLTRVGQALQNWQIRPNGTEGYRTAEVTLGGIDTHALSSRTLAVREFEGLYFIGEVVDVTGWLGGYNFQWAWSSGWCAGQVV